MARQFATGKHALGICDICGWQFKLDSLRKLRIKDTDTNLLVCRVDWNESHPQLRLGDKEIDDPQALRNPRPEQDYGRSDAGWAAALDQLTRHHA
jgi:hypothetical protein